MVIMQNYKVSILGCGWLGFALAKKLSKDYQVFCSVSSDKSIKNLTHQNKTILNEDNGYIDANFYQTDRLIIAIPPRGNYLSCLDMISQQIKPNTQVILLSSISVYGQTSGIVTEKMCRAIDSGAIMIEGEKLLQQSIPSLLILRLGGLMGYDRIAGKYSAGKTMSKNSFINYVHRDDVVDVLKQCIEQNITHDIFNVVAPFHSSRKEVYDYHASKYGFEKTFFVDETLGGKKVSSQKLQKQLGFKFKHNTLETICNS